MKWHILLLGIIFFSGCFLSANDTTGSDFQQIDEPKKKVTTTTTTTTAPTTTLQTQNVVTKKQKIVPKKYHTVVRVKSEDPDFRIQNLTYNKTHYCFNPIIDGPSILAKYDKQYAYKFRPEKTDYTYEKVIEKEVLELRTSADSKIESYEKNDDFVFKNVTIEDTIQITKRNFSKAMPIAFHAKEICSELVAGTDHYGVNSTQIEIFNLSAGYFNYTYEIEKDNTIGMFPQYPQSEKILVDYRFDQDGRDNYYDYSGNYGDVQANYGDCQQTTLLNNYSFYYGHNFYAGSECYVRPTIDFPFASGGEYFMSRNKTFNAWLFVYDASVSGGIFSLSSAYEDPSPAQLVRVVSGRFAEYGFKNSLAGDYLEADFAIQDNTWYMLTVTYNDSSSRGYEIYINGQNQTYVSGTDGSYEDRYFETGNSHFYIGTGFNDQFEGVIDNVVFWNTTLSYKEIKDMYNFFLSNSTYTTEVVELNDSYNKINVTTNATIPTNSYVNVSVGNSNGSYQEYKDFSTSESWSCNPSSVYSIYTCDKMFDNIHTGGSHWIPNTLGHEWVLVDLKKVYAIKAIGLILSDSVFDRYPNDINFTFSVDNESFYPFYFNKDTVYTGSDAVPGSLFTYGFCYEENSDCDQLNRTATNATYGYNQDIYFNARWINFSVKKTYSNTQLKIYSFYITGLNDSINLTSKQQISDGTSISSFDIANTTNFVNVQYDLFSNGTNTPQINSSEILAYNEEGAGPGPDEPICPTDANCYIDCSTTNNISTAQIRPDYDIIFENAGECVIEEKLVFNNLFVPDGCSVYFDSADLLYLD